MKSQRGMTLVTLVLIIIVLMIIAGAATYVVMGPNGVLNREEVQPLNTVSNEVNV